MIQNKLEIKLKNVVIGSSLEAVLFAFFGKHKLIYTRKCAPHQLDKVEDFGLGTDILTAWNRHVFLMGLAGYIPFGDRVAAIKYLDNSTIKILTSDESTVHVKFEHLYVFDDHQFLNLPPSIKTTSDEIRIVDWFKMIYGNPRDCEIINNKTRFMNQVIFYERGLVSNSNKKDICVVSYCKRNRLDDFPEHLVKVKTESLMKEYEMYGFKRNKLHPKIEHEMREITDYGKNIYENFDNVEFLYHDPKFVFDLNRRRVKIDYMKYLSMKLGI